MVTFHIHDFVGALGCIPNATDRMAVVNDGIVIPTD
jgi:hypothetical protein